MPKATRKFDPTKSPLHPMEESAGERPQLDPVPMDAEQPTAPPSLKGAMDLWHKRLNMISGTMVLCYGKSGIKRETLRSWTLELRHIANSMERFLK
jgi:hypothetical protein